MADPRLSAALLSCGVRWLLPRVKPRVDHVPGSLRGPHAVLRDDLLHPLCSGNKLRKLDAVFPRLIERGVTDVVTCGGAQSAHTAAVAVTAAELGLRAHLVLRGESPPSPTGYTLVSQLYASTISYVTRDLYGSSADRHDALAVGLARATAHSPGLSPPSVIGEGGRDPAALLGLVRLVSELAEGVAGSVAFPLAARRVVLVCAAGTGTTAVGLALGIALGRLPWRVVGVPVAATPDALDAAGAELLRRLPEASSALAGAVKDAALMPTESSPFLSHLPLTWTGRLRPRRFGVALPDDVSLCSAIARASGILVDPMYTLAAWEVAGELRNASAATSATDVESLLAANGGEFVIVIHTGGTLGLFSLAQRSPHLFDSSHLTAPELQNSHRRGRNRNAAKAAVQDSESSEPGPLPTRGHCQ